MKFARMMSLLFLVFLHAIARADDPKELEYAIAIHGGAGVEPDKLSDAERKQLEDSLALALRAGQRSLADGAAALDVVEQVIRILEDDPLFNAGRGSVFNAEGKHELDASIMDGRTKAAGAVAAVRTVKNPISLARLVMTETRHVLLAGDGAEQFADQMREHKSIERVENSYFSTPAERADWERSRAAAKEKNSDKDPAQKKPMSSKPKAQPNRSSKGTVGCVVLDKQGNLAAGTSTGGLSNKRFGRIGDSPIVGAGTYADNATCAVSCTGTGELFIRDAIAFRVSALMQYKGLGVEAAVAEAVFKVLPHDAGGVIAVDHHGAISLRHNTPGLACGAADSSGKFEVKLANPLPKPK